MYIHDDIHNAEIRQTSRQEMGARGIKLENQDIWGAMALFISTTL